MIAFAIASGWLLILPWAPSGHPARWPANWAAMLARQSVSHAASRLGSRSRQPARPGQIRSTMRNPRENQKNKKKQRFQRNWGTPLPPDIFVFCFFVFFGFPDGFATFVCRVCLVGTLQIITYITPEDVGGTYVSHRFHQRAFGFV